jgi:crotonobetainyl-CoA:carnitine CoA-transferase CaiB-like acyl-CoA transferase
VNSQRLRNRAELVKALEPTFIQRTVEDWVARFLAAGVPAGPINDFDQVFAAEHTSAREMKIEIDHPVEGRVPALGFPIKLSGTPQTVRYAAPLLGQHRQEILEEIGLGGQSDHLGKAGAFG